MIVAASGTDPSMIFNVNSTYAASNGLFCSSNNFVEYTTYFVTWQLPVVF